MEFEKTLYLLFYNLNNIARIILSSDLTKSGRQTGSRGVVEYPVCEVTPPRPANFSTLVIKRGYFFLKE
jgi:hypothetical protein